MFLYELALELDRKSVDLVEIGDRLGLGALSPSTMLTPEQVAQLRAAAGHAVPNPHGAAFGQAPSGPAVWGDPALQPPPAPAGGPEVPAAAAGKGRGVLIAAAAAVLVVVAALAFVVTGGRDGGGEEAGNPDLIAGLDKGSQGSEARDADAGVTPTALDPEKIAAGLPGSHALAPLLAGRTGYTWGAAEDTTKMAATAGGENLGGQCTPETQPQGYTVRQHSLGDTEGGNHGGVSVSIRTFNTAEEADSWLAAHTTDAYKACQAANLRGEIASSMGDVTSDSYAQESGVQGGPQDRYSADYTQPSGALCTAYRDVYFNVVGTVGISTRFDTCHDPFDAAAEDQVVEAMLATLPKPASPTS